MTTLYASSASPRVTSPASIVQLRGTRDGAARRTGHMIAVASTFLLACFALATDAAAASIYAFGQSTLSSPSNATPGTVVGRYYFTPEDVCGKSTCQITDITMNSKGSVWGSTSGPDLETNVSGLSTRMLIDGKVAVSSTKATLRDTIEVQLFRDSRQPKDGSLNSGSLNGYYYIHYKSGILGETTIVFLDAKVSFINGTCSVPDQNVTLPPVQKRDFNGVGSTAGATDFHVQLNNCPAGYNRIGYQLDPLDDVVVGMSGGMRLRPDATARGVGIHIADAATGRPLTLRQSHTVTNYNRATGGSPSIPLRASYLQTDATIGGGSVHAAAQILLDYQ
ncbi:fimbrial protein [Burkholderia cenocepacia]|uniref:fimbrial protein n=1 Tax=Burkholderia cenocepacia TaxID=95486 RepID=UPI000ADB71E1|nr:fimbrial protein [Burkholderia cenocepacia]CAB5109646.1 fimbrial protein [Burkholderia cenocepacia]CAB5110520.1 fimbrial protein [Burkholderia cenocepacia]CAB5110683.1 fimbrial protein [Burkholderia cenocepacia]CAB5114605.1 fimbrial protein [Burkholderia cenocepacia]CAB5115869.1 fimbrial protein [Burkholderia cenocepacia]